MDDVKPHYIGMKEKQTEKAHNKLPYMLVSDILLP